MADLELLTEVAVSVAGELAVHVAVQARLLDFLLFALLEPLGRRLLDLMEEGALGGGHAHRHVRVATKLRAEPRSRGRLRRRVRATHQLLEQEVLAVAIVGAKELVDGVQSRPAAWLLVSRPLNDLARPERLVHPVESLLERCACRKRRAGRQLLENFGRHRTACCTGGAARSQHDEAATATGLDRDELEALFLIGLEHLKGVR